MKNILKDKKGFEFNVATGIIFAIVGFAFAIMIGLFVLSSITNAGFLSSGRISYTVTDESDTTGRVAWINATGYQLTMANTTTADYVIVGINNRSVSGNYNITILIPNATISAAGIITNSSVLNYNNVSINYTYTDQPQNEYLTDAISNNVTTGLHTVIGKIPTVFAIIGIIIVLSIIGLLIIIVRKFGFGGGASNFGQ